MRLNTVRSEVRQAAVGPGSCMVFVVDDDPSVRKSLDRLLRSVGYQVQTYDSARAFMGRPQLAAVEAPFACDRRDDVGDGLHVEAVDEQHERA